MKLFKLQVDSFYIVCQYFKDFQFLQRFQTFVFKGHFVVLE
jgi:hypothetical protein